MANSGSNVVAPEYIKWALALNGQTDCLIGLKRGFNSFTQGADHADRKSTNNTESNCMRNQRHLPDFSFPWISKEISWPLIWSLFNLGTVSCVRFLTFHADLLNGAGRAIYRVRSLGATLSLQPVTGSGLSCGASLAQKVESASRLSVCHQEPHNPGGNECAKCCLCQLSLDLCHSERRCRGQPAFSHFQHSGAAEAVAGSQDPKLTETTNVFSEYLSLWMCSVLNARCFHPSNKSHCHLNKIVRVMEMPARWSWHHFNWLSLWATEQPDHNDVSNMCYL